jgi:hypothetical protein
VPFLPVDPGWVKNQDPGSGSGMSNPDHISESLETIFWVKILKFFDAVPGSGTENIRIRDKLPDPQKLLLYADICTYSVLLPPQHSPNSNLHQLTFSHSHIRCGVFSFFYPLWYRKVKQKLLVL